MVVLFSVFDLKPEAGTRPVHVASSSCQYGYSWGGGGGGAGGVRRGSGRETETPLPKEHHKTENTRLFRKLPSVTTACDQQAQSVSTLLEKEAAVLTEANRLFC